MGHILSYGNNRLYQEVQTTRLSPNEKFHSKPSIIKRFLYLCSSKILTVLSGAGEQVPGGRK
jgi:hypothetical protein